MQGSLDAVPVGTKTPGGICLFINCQQSGGGADRGHARAVRHDVDAGM